MDAPETPYYQNNNNKANSSLFESAINKNVRLYFFKDPGLGRSFSSGIINEIKGEIEKVQGEHLLFKSKNDSYIFPIKNIASLKFL